MRHILSKNAFRVLASTCLVVLFGCPLTLAQEQRPVGSAPGKPPYNIVFVISDQRSYRLFAGGDYSLPAIGAIASRGVSFSNHYIASAMCSPSRASFLTGQPPQVHQVFDQMEYPYTPALDPNLPNMGSVLKSLGYKTAYFGKFEMDKSILETKPTINYSGAIEPYGFDVFSAGGDIGSSPQSGFDNDRYIAGETVRWLRENAGDARRGGKPFFVVASFVNPHDIMYGNANIPGQTAVEKAVSAKALPPLPANAIYQKNWPSTFRRAFRNRSPVPACRARCWNTRRAGTDGQAAFPPIARTCGAFFTTTISCHTGSGRRSPADRGRLERDGYVAGHCRCFHRRPW